MPRFTQLTRVAFATAMIALGAIGLLFRDFAVEWGRVPAWLPSAAGLAALWAVVPLVAGIGLLFRRTASAASVVLLAFVACWWVLFRLPLLVTAPRTEGSWLVSGMVAMVVVAAWLQSAALRGGLSGDHARRRILAGRILGLALIPVGLSHFAYLELTVPLVPSWLPDHTGWAYFTGACHLAAGLGLLIGVLPRLAAQLEAAMLGIFTIVVWIPILIAAPGTRSNWREIFMSWLLTAATAVVAAYLPARYGVLDDVRQTSGGIGEADVAAAPTPSGL